MKHVSLIFFLSLRNSP